jgi:hypothetical protein
VISVSGSIAEAIRDPANLGQIIFVEKSEVQDPDGQREEPDRG